MRDWLKNVLVTLYERDEDNNLLTEKLKLRVRRCCGKHRLQRPYNVETNEQT